MWHVLPILERSPNFSRVVSGWFIMVTYWHVKIFPLKSCRKFAEFLTLMLLNYRNCYREVPRQMIHADSERDVADVREQMALLARQQPSGDADVRRRQGDRDYTCPVCMDDARFSVETNCGHVFCGQWNILLLCNYRSESPLQNRGCDCEYAFSGRLSLTAHGMIVIIISSFGYCEFGN